MKQWHRTSIAALLAIGFALGCGGGDAAVSKPSTKLAKKSVEEETRTDSSSTSGGRRKFKPVQLGDDGAESGGDLSSKKKIPDEEKAPAIVAALQPFQVLLGDWRWGTRKQFGDFAKTGEDLKWVWDFQSDPNRPALKAVSDDNPYFRKIWLTWLPDDGKFQLTGKTPDGESRVLQGAWTGNGEPREESDGKRTQHSYKLLLTQVSPVTGEQWQTTLNQLDNNQYLMVLARSPATGKPFAQVDTVRQQRVGTSFAVPDSDNPGPKCIISGGLGTIQVEYKGKSYPVCCSGCAAAFKDDPERWLAKLAEKEKMKKKDE
jgi:hypothetical protein